MDSAIVIIPPGIKDVMLHLEPGEKIRFTSANTLDVKIVTRTGKDKLHLTGADETT